MLPCLRLDISCPNARVIIIGGDAISYGRRPEQGANWRERMLAEVGSRLDLDRVTFVGWLPYEQYLAVLQISAAKRQGFGPVWKAIADAHASAYRKMPTPVLTRLVLEAVQHQAPKRAGTFRPKLRYAHQGGMNPPLVIVHGNSLEHVTDAYKRFLEGRIRDHFKLSGTPLRIEMRSSKNPFVERRG